MKSGDQPMGVGIMAPPALTVDVRDMLCAQALALTSQTLERLQIGQVAQVLYNAEDVRRDLLVWANDRGHVVRVEAPGMLHLERR